MRRWLVSGVLLLAACSSGQDSAAIEDASLTRTFFAAMFDEMRGPPSAEALARHVEFAQGGIRFQYPEPLRVSVDRDPYASWSLERGDFELDLHTPASEITAADYLGTLAETLGANDDDAEGPLEGRKVHWCGQDITGVLYRFKFLGDPQVFEGFDLPPTREGPRFLVFNDIRKKDDWSETAQATFAAVDASIECDGGKIPVRDSVD